MPPIQSGPMPKKAVDWRCYVPWRTEKSLNYKTRKKKTKKPVVAYFQGLATSGGYYVAMAADTVVAHPTAVTGSIGVLMWNLSLAGLMDKIGVEDRTLKSGPYKDAGSWLRKMTPEERAQLQSVLDDFFVRFKEVVDAGRPNLDRQKVDVLADGRIYSARQAKEHGLVDQIGYLEDALAEIKKRTKSEKMQVVIYRTPSSYRSSVYTQPQHIDISLIDLDEKKLERHVGTTIEAPVIHAQRIVIPHKAFSKVYGYCFEETLFAGAEE